MKYLKTKIAILLIVIFLFPITNGLLNNKTKNDTVKVYDISTNQIFEITENEYIIGVVSAEMPAEFEIEALKAQIVACRTYLASKENCDKHIDADICTDSTHCQAYLTNENLKSQWGENFKKYISKIKSAEKQTNKEMIYYQNEPIKSVYHSTSSGKTENSEDVWGSDTPYLKSVDSSDDINSPKYLSDYSVDLFEFKEIMKNKYNDIDFNYKPVGNITRSEGGSVKTIDIYNKHLKGNDIRNIFNLQSANFDMKIEDNIVTFKVYGYGHGVGMSQYGANFLAKKGYNYKEILLHYYTGVDIK